MSAIDTPPATATATANANDVTTELDDISSIHSVSDDESNSHHEDSILKMLDEVDQTTGSSTAEPSKKKLNTSQCKAAKWAVFNGLIHKVDEGTNDYTIDGVNTFTLDGDLSSRLRDYRWVNNAVAIIVDHCNDHQLFTSWGSGVFRLPTQKVDGVIQYRHKKAYKPKTEYKSYKTAAGSGSGSGVGSDTRTTAKRPGQNIGQECFTIIGQNEDGMPVKIILSSILALSFPDGKQMTHHSFGMK